MTEQIWTNNQYGDDLAVKPYVAVDGYTVHLHVGDTRWTESCYWGGPDRTMSLAKRTGLPVWVARRDYRRIKSYCWEKVS